MPPLAPLSSSSSDPRAFTRALLIVFSVQPLGALSHRRCRHRHRGMATSSAWPLAEQHSSLKVLIFAEFSPAVDSSPCRLFFSRRNGGRQSNKTNRINEDSVCSSPLLEMRESVFVDSIRFFLFNPCFFSCFSPSLSLLISRLRACSASGNRNCATLKVFGIFEEVRDLAHRGQGELFRRLN